MITLAATVYDGVLSDIRWRDADGGIWTVISNVDMRVFRSMTDFSDESGHWTLFLFVDELIEDFTDSAQTGGADTGLLTSTASLSPVELAALGAEKPAYVVLGLEGQLAPSALHEELGALHRHYAANREALLIRYRNAAALEEERRAWRDANPPSPRATVINFWKIK